jgi:hypothetical protein
MTAVLKRRRAVLGASMALLAAGLAGFLGGSGNAATQGPTFGAPIYVDQQLAGGEPEVIADTVHGTLVYTAHEGTTHLYRDGLVSSPWGDFSFVSNYCNQVNIWTSRDGGANWFRARYLGSPCPTSPAINTGFSDPDLTFDAGGRLYNTGIDPVNDAPDRHRHLQLTRGRRRRSSCLRPRRQKPKCTLVKYQNADVLQSAISTVNSVPPTSGSVQRGWSRSRTKKTFTAKTA